jgi:outer membrane biosynthesis protein TonB
VACQNCQQNSFVAIGSKKYCTNCGSLSNPATIVASMHDVAGPAEVYKSPAQPTIATKPVSAQSLHGTSALASGGVLDLRKPSVKPGAAPVVTRPASFTDIAPRPQAQPAPAPTPSIAPVADPILVVAPQPAPPVATPAPQPAPAPMPQPVVDAKPQPSLREMAAQLSSPSEIKAAAEKKQSLQKPLSVGAAALAVVVMGGYIWVSNYNNLSIRTASQRAGIVASLPNYAPSNYKLNGPISYGTGFVSFNLKNTKESDKSIAVIQRKSDWDSASLLELYVAPKSKDYVAVDSRGLKVYLYGDGQATWVNKGLQYVVQANSSLSRDQIVKMAESL